MIPLVLKKELWAELLENGVIKIPFLEREELKELQGFYNNVHPDGVPPKMYDNIHMTTWYKNRFYKYAIKAGIDKITFPAYERVFQNFRVLNQVFIVKMPSPETTFNIHQDWNVVDEKKFPSLNIWVPLQDVNAENGAMWIIKKSHRLPVYIRGAGSLFPNYMDYMDELAPYMSSYPMKAGEALVFFHGTIHGSPPNKGKYPRVVAASGIVPKNCPLRIYFHPPGSDKIHLYEPEDDFAYRYKSLREDSEVKAPGGKLVKKIALAEFYQPDISDILKVINSSLTNLE